MIDLIEILDIIFFFFYFLLIFIRVCLYLILKIFNPGVKGLNLILQSMSFIAEEMPSITFFFDELFNLDIFVFDDIL